MANGSSINTPFLLFPDETVLFKTNPHWIFLLLRCGSILLMWLFYELYACPYLSFTSLNGVCFLLSGVVFPFAILVFYLDWLFDRFYLTNFRVVKSRGFLGKRFMSIFLEQIEDITASYSLWGELFGFGDLQIESAGTYGKITAEGIPNPLIKKWLIEGAKKSMHGLLLP